MAGSQMFETGVKVKMGIKVPDNRSDTMNILDSLSSLLSPG